MSGLLQLSELLLLHELQQCVDDLAVGLLKQHMRTRTSTLSSNLLYNEYLL